MIKMLETFQPNRPRECLKSALNALLIRKYADNREAIIIRPFTYTHWILGAFEDIEFKTTDYLPFIRIYYSNMKKISHLYGLDRYFSKAQIDPNIRKILIDLEIPSVEKLDQILEYIIDETIDLGSESTGSRDIGEETLKKILEKIKKSNIKKITPTPIP